MWWLAVVVVALPMVAFLAVKFERRSIQQRVRVDGKKAIFATSKDFFRYFCNLAPASVKPRLGMAIPSFVEDPSFRRKGLLAGVLLRVVSRDRRWLTVAAANPADADRLKKGDLVLWTPESFDASFAKTGVDERRAWVGSIFAQIAPEVEISNDSGWTILRLFSSPLDTYPSQAESSVSISASTDPKLR